MTHVNQVINELALIVERRRRLRNNIIGFDDSREILDVLRDNTVNDPPIRAFEEAIVVCAGVRRQRVDQTDVWAFRRFNRANPAVMGWVNVANFKAGTLTGQSAWAKGRNTTLVRHL